MNTLVRPFVLGWHFLTGIPLTRDHHQPTGMELASSMGWYSTIGFIIGGLLAMLDLVLGRWFSPPVLNVLVIISLILLTRGLHLDGLADTVDGLAGGHDRAARLVIMRDPHMGALGATGLMLSLLLRYAALLSLPQSLRMPVLVCMPAVGRWSLVMLSGMSPYARAEGGLAAPFVAHLSVTHLVLATTVLALGLTISLGTFRAISVMALGGVLVCTCSIGCRRWFGGITGDTLGATNELAEIFFLLFIPIFSSQI